MFTATVNEAAHWATAGQNKSLCGVFVKDTENAPPAVIEEAEVLFDQTVIDIGDRLLFYK